MCVHSGNTSACTHSGNLFRERAKLTLSCVQLRFQIYIILIARVRVQYGKIFYEHAKYFHEPKASENVA